MSKQSSYSYEEILAIANGVEGDNAENRLPLPNMLMFDRITHISTEGGKYGKGQIVAELDINPDMWFFACHFKGDPVMPGSLGFDGMLQLTGFFLHQIDAKGRGRALGADNIKFFGQILPTSKLVTYVIDIKRVFNSKLTLILADGKIQCDGEDIYTCENMRVGLMG